MDALEGIDFHRAKLKKNELPLFNVLPEHYFLLLRLEKPDDFLHV